MSFFLDWWMLLAIGIFISLICKQSKKEDSFLIYTLSIPILAGFMLMSMGLFFQLDYAQPFFELIKTYGFPEYYKNHPNATSTEFMYSSGLEQLKPLVPFNNLNGLVKCPYHLLFGMIMFTLYPALLYGGTRIGFLLFGTKKLDKGVIGFL